MATLKEALHEALRRKREEDMARDIEARRKAREPQPEPLRVKYVKCTGCKQVERFDEFMFHGGRPHFCRCPPGHEHLVTFLLEVEDNIEKVIT